MTVLVFDLLTELYATIGAIKAMYLFKYTVKHYLTWLIEWHFRLKQQKLIAF
jgi:hypothetical protein